MNGAILLVAANEKCPQPQTKEHLMALTISHVNNIIIVQNKIDLVSEADAQKNYDQIKTFVKGTCAENAPIIPVSAHHDINIDALIQTIEKVIPTPKRDQNKPPLMHVARSFDVNKPGIKPSELLGGVVGGSLIQGTLEVGEKIEIAPGRKVETEGKSQLEPIFTTVSSLITGGKGVEKAFSGGLLAIGTELDPSLVKSDSFAGKVVGRPGELPPVVDTLTLTMCLLKRVVGTVDEKSVDPLKTNEPLMLTVGTATTVGVITDLRSDWIRVRLKLPVCADKGQRIAVSRRIEGKWHLIGYAEIKATG